MRVQPENLTEVWEGAKKDILADHPELPETRAGELAAARVFNWFHEDWATFRDAIRDEVKNSASRPEGVDSRRLQLYDKLIDWTPMYRLQQVSGSRNLMRDLEHPIVTERSTPPAELIRIRNHWRTERMEGVLETFSDLKEAWGNIRAEFRGRANGEGRLYTNSQGIHAIKTTFELIQQKPYSGRVDALTTNLSGALQAIDYFRDQALVLGGKAGACLNNLADLFEDAILDAMTNKREGFAAVDTTVPGDKDDPPLTYLKKLLRHEATHVWQYTVNHKRPGLLSDKVIKNDPDYPRLKRAFSTYYANIKPNEIVAEAVAFVVSGDWKKAGFTDEEQGLKFINRFFSKVVIRYGENALDSLRSTHPTIKKTIKEVMENVRRIPIREHESGREAATDFGSGPESVAQRSGNDGEATRDRAPIRSTQGRLAGGWTGEDVGGLRRDSADHNAVRSSPWEINLLDSRTAKQPGLDNQISVSHALRDSAPPVADLPRHASLDDLDDKDDGRRDVANTDLIKSLQTIASIESIDPDGMRYTWRELAIESAMIAREALAYHEIQRGSFEELGGGPPSGNGAFSKSDANHMVEALQEIANIEFLDPGQYSWKDRVVIAGTIASDALTRVSLWYGPGQEESLSSQVADRDKSAPDNLSLSNTLSDIRGLDREYEESDLSQSFSF